MNELYLRTEDIDDSEIQKLYVSTKQDDDTVKLLKSRTPVILVGSRGVGKSFLMKEAANELKEEFKDNHILPVYLTFIKSSLVAVNQKGAFLYWMLANISSAIVRTLKKHGIIVRSDSNIDILSGGHFDANDELKIDKIKEAFENSWRSNEPIDSSTIPTVEDLRNSVTEICEDNGISRIVLFIDEAAHIFIREQQDQFFTLYRDLRCPKITCKASVYPGVTAYGNNFQYSQDATFVYLNRPITDVSYVMAMKDMVLKQIEDGNYLKELSRRGESFTDLTYAASGNPRFLLNNIRTLPKINTNEINQCIKEFYRITILADHTALSSKYPNLKVLIDWGRKFLEDTLLPEMQARNTEALASGKPTTCYFWIHKDAPDAAKRAISLLEYSGLVQEVTKGLKATGGEIGTRYMVNIGCLFALEANPLTLSHSIVEKFDVRKFIEFGMNSQAFNDIKDQVQLIADNDLSESLEVQLSEDISVLKISDTLKNKIRELGYNTIKDVLNATEEQIKRAYYVGNVRSRRIKNVALTAIYEYLIG